MKNFFVFIFFIVSLSLGVLAAILFPDQIRSFISIISFEKETRTLTPEELRSRKEIVGAGYAVVKQVEKVVLAPPPLRVPFQLGPTISLDDFGVIHATNDERAKFGKSILAENEALRLAAEMKLKDMFAKQYFEHTSPEGLGPDHFVEGEGYRYRIIGENLALGNFESDEALVEAWMNSQGHRENILRDSFAEIGVAVGRGTIEGQETWVAVQMFGRPIPVCDAPDDAKRVEIVRLNGELSRMNDLRASLRREIKEKYAAWKSADEEFERYDLLLAEYSSTDAKVKEIAAAYNTEVFAYNACVVY